jgi:hypothetical protein
MSMETYDNDCPGCRPAIVDVATGKIMPQDSPVMQIINQLFNKLTPEERQAWHSFICQNSRDPKVIEYVGRFTGQIEAALVALEAMRN